MPQPVLRERVRVLLVEDNPGDADLVRELLATAERPAVEIDHVERLRDAVERIRSGAVDVVLLDLSLPDADGLEALRRVRAAAADLPVVVLTGSDESIGTEAMHEGAQDYLRKGDVGGELLARALRYAVLRHKFREREQLLVREREARVAAEEAVDARDEFLAIAAHELRTPLAALHLQLSQLERLAHARPDDPDCARCGDKLGRGTRQLARLKRLVSSLLDVSRITGGRLTVDPSHVDLARIAQRVVDEFGSAATAAGCALALEVPEPVPGQWDASALEQVVTNLLSNALKYGAGKPVEVSVRRVDGAAVLSVRDHGIGIDPESAARIFERFERAVSMRHYGGLGLGLFIVRHIAEAHGGSVAVESRPGEGSTFTVRLPVLS